MMSPADTIPDDSSDAESDEGLVDENAELQNVNGQTDSIEFEKVEQGSPKRPRSIRSYWLDIIIVLIAGVTWIVWGDYLSDPDPNQVPLVKAKDGQFKIRPMTPGGMPIPNQDKTVYDTFENKATQPGAETLLPEPEQLLPMPQRSVPDFAKRNPTESSPSNMAVENLLNNNRLPKKNSVPKFEDNEKLTELRVPITPKALPSRNQSSKSGSEDNQKDIRNDSKSNRLSLINPSSQKRENIAENVETGSSSFDFPKSSFQVQLAAVRNQLAAQNEWQRLKTRHSVLLGKLSSRIVRADLGAKGIYFRLRAGPLIDRGSAKKLCKELQKIKVNCLVIRPGR